MSESEYVCPECGNGTFGIVLRQVGFGPVEQFGDTRDITVLKNGPVLDAEGDVFCKSCDTEYAMDDLPSREQYRKQIEENEA